MIGRPRSTHGVRAALVACLAIVSVVFTWPGAVNGQPWRYPVPTDSGYGLIDERGVIVSDARFEALSEFVDGIAAARAEGRWGYVDERGAWIVEPVYLAAESFSGGTGRVRDDAGWWLVDPSGRRLGDLPHPEILPMSDGHAAFRAAEAPGGREAWGLLDRTGRIVVDALFDGARPYTEGRYPVQRYRRFLFFRTERRWGYADSTGAWIIEPGYTSARSFSEGLALVSTGGKGRFLHPDGSVAFDLPHPLGYPFAGGFARVGENGRWGFIDTTGSMAIELRYEAASDFSGGLAAVRRDGRWGYVDSSGREVITVQLDRAGDFRGPLALVVSEGRTAYIDRTGRIVWGG